MLALGNVARQALFVCKMLQRGNAIHKPLIQRLQSVRQNAYNPAMNDVALSPRLLHEDATERLRDMIVHGELASGAIVELMRKAVRLLKRGILQ